MDIVKLIKEDVLEAFSNGKTGVPSACREFGISRAAICQWSSGREIPAERRLHLLFKRPDIIQKVSAIQNAKNAKSKNNNTVNEAV